MTMLLCLLAAGSYVLGGVCMRRAAGFSQLVPSLMVFVWFCLGAALQTAAMRRSELGVNYLVVLGFEAGLALLLGVTCFGESLSARKVAGLALILAGVVSLRLGEASPDHGTTVARALSSPETTSPSGR